MKIEEVAVDTGAYKVHHVWPFGRQPLYKSASLIEAYLALLGHPPVLVDRKFELNRSRDDCHITDEGIHHRHSAALHLRYQSQDPPRVNHRVVVRSLKISQGYSILNIAGLNKNYEWVMPAGILVSCDDHISPTTIHSTDKRQWLAE